MLPAILKKQKVKIMLHNNLQIVLMTTAAILQTTQQHRALWSLVHNVAQVKDHAAHPIVKLCPFSRNKHVTQMANVITKLFAMVKHPNVHRLIQNKIHYHAKVEAR